MEKIVLNVINGSPVTNDEAKIARRLKEDQIETRMLGSLEGNEFKEEYPQLHDIIFFIMREMDLGNLSFVVLEHQDPLFGVPGDRNYVRTLYPTDGYSIRKPLVLIDEELQNNPELMIGLLARDLYKIHKWQGYRRFLEMFYGNERRMYFFIQNLMVYGDDIRFEADLYAIGLMVYKTGKTVQECRDVLYNYDAKTLGEFHDELLKDAEERFGDRPDYSKYYFQFYKVREDHKDE